MNLLAGSSSNTKASSRGRDLHKLSVAMSTKISLPQTLTKLIQGGDFGEAANVVSELVCYLDSVYDAALSDPENDEAKNNAGQVLSEIHQSLSTSSLDQEVIDALSFELPKAVSLFAGVSERCLEIAESIIDWFVETCNPKEMISYLCDALSALSETDSSPHYVIPLLSGIPKVILSINRRHYEHIRTSVPVIIQAIKNACDENHETKMFSEVFARAIKIANSIQEVCAKLEEKTNEKLRALLGLYVLNIMVVNSTSSTQIRFLSELFDYVFVISVNDIKAIVSVSSTDKIPTRIPLVSELSFFFPYCGFSYLGLITESDVDKITCTIVQDDNEENDVYLRSLSYIKLGACLSVIWGVISNDVVQAAQENLNAVMDELQSNQISRWQALGMLRHILSSANLPWGIKARTTNFLLCIMDVDASRKCNDEHADYSIYMPTLFGALQAIIMTIIYAPDKEPRKNSYKALQKVLADIPAAMRFDILLSLVTNCDSSAMTAILIDLVRTEMRTEKSQRKPVEKYEDLQSENQACGVDAVFWSPRVFELLELILRLREAPYLPELGDAILAALNLYRFILITESSEKTNHTGVLTKSSLQKALVEWLLPLRILVTRTVAENSDETVCSLNPVELVLYRCIELVEEQLRHQS